MRVLMVVWTSVATDTRVLREARALVAAGHSVHIIGRAVPTGFEPPTGITVASVGRPPASQERGRALTPPERTARWALLPTHVRRRLGAWREAALAVAADQEADVVHAHDVSALPVGAELASRWSVPLIYDSHEFWAGRPTEGRPAPLAKARAHSEERRFGAQAAAIITVGDDIAEALRAEYGWERIHVVRNSFPFREDLPAPLDEPTGLVYGGRLAHFRELEVASAASGLIDLPITAVGPGDDTWLAAFDPGRMSVVDSEAIEQLDLRLLGAGAALVTHSDRWLNHRLAMPNKLFHAVSLGVPVVATDVGALAATVREFGLGTLYPPGDAKGMAEAARELVRRYGEFVQNVRDARPELSWPRDEAVLTGLYTELASR